MPAWRFSVLDQAAIARLAGFLRALGPRVHRLSLTCCTPYDIEAQRRRFPAITWLPDDEATRETYSHDYSIFEVKPEAVIFPKDVDDVKSLVKFVSEKKKVGESISLTARSAGTDMTGGPLTQSIVVDFLKYFNIFV